MSVSLKHITKSNRQQVYPPSQDTFLLIDSLVLDMQFISSLDPSFILEIGVGSGAIIASLSSNSLIKSFYLGVDINPYATSLANSTIKLNNCTNVDLINIDIFGKMNLNNKVDIIICNPPYVVTSSEEYLQCQKKKDIDSSFAGGENGREFIDKLFMVAKEILTDHGVLYLLFEEQNGIFEGVKLLEQRRGCENLAVVRMNKEQIIKIL